MKHFHLSDARTRYFVVCAAVTVLLSAAGALWNLPYAGIIVPVVLGGMLLMDMPEFMLIAYFVCCSFSPHLFLLTPDNFLTPFFLAAAVMHPAASPRGGHAPFLRKLMIAGALWAVVGTVLHWADYDTQRTLLVGFRLASYYAIFLASWALASNLNVEALRRVIIRVWIASVIVDLVALYQGVVEGSTRVSSILEPHHAHLGNYTALALMFAAMVVVIGRSTGTRLLATVSVVAAMGAMIMSANRANILGTGVGLLLFGLLRGWRGMLAVAAIVCAVVVIQPFSEALVSRAATTVDEKTPVAIQSGMETKVDPSSVDRILVWVGVLTRLQAESFGELLAGVGPGNFEFAMRPFLTLHQIYVRVPTGSINGAHNNMLHLWIESGLIGLLLTAGILIGLLTVFRRIGRSSIAKHRTLTALAFCTTISLIVSSLTQETFYAQPAMGSFFGLFLAFAAVFIQYVLANRDGERISSELAPGVGGAPRSIAAP
jgi:hypothetical protein